MAIPNYLGRRPSDFFRHCIYENEARRMKNYPPDWPEIAERIKRKNNYRCEICGHKHDPENGYCLTVHHLDRDPENNEEYNLASLCQRGHLRLEAHAKRLEKRGETVFSASWFPTMLRETIYAEWFKPHLEGYLRSKRSENYLSPLPKV